MKSLTANNDKININKLATEHGKRLYYFVLKRVRNHDTAEDLVQATYIQAMECQESFLGHSKPETWLMGIALNLVRTHVHRQHKFGMAALDDLENWQETIDQPQTKALEEQVSQQEQIQQIRVAFTSMPEEMAKTATLVLLHGLAYQDVAKMQAIPVGTVRSRISRARAYFTEHAA